LKKNTENELKDQATTQVYQGADNVTEIRVQTLSTASKRLDICDDSIGTVALIQFQPVRSALVNAAKNRGIHVRFITDVRQENIASCKELMEFVELRHLGNVKGNFVVTEKEYYAFTEIKESKIPLQAIYSKASVIVEQQQYVFDTLWNSAMPAKLKIQEIEQGILPFETKIVRGEKEIVSLAYSLIERSLNSHLYVTIDDRAPDDRETGIQYVKNLMSKNPKFQFLLVADIQKKNADYYKLLIELGVQVKHVERNKVTFVLSDSEYLSGGPTTNSREATEATWTNNPEIITQMNQIFQSVWRNAIPGEARIKQLEEGTEPQETKLFDDIHEVLLLGRELTNQVQFEQLIIAASDKTILRNREAFQELSKRQQEIGFKIRILAPLADPAVFDILPGAEWRKVDPTSVSVMIFDRKWMLITQYADSGAATTEKAVSSNIYSTNQQTILGMVSVFEALWRESELRDSEARARAQVAKTLEKEEMSRRQAQLLQDILTHDIRNYNQVSKLSAELLKEKFATDPEVQALVDSLLQSIDGSTSLVERGRKLGKILSEESAFLVPVRLVETIQRSLTLVREGNKDRMISEETLLPEGLRASGILVQADDLLDEVFSNIFSNSVKYSGDPSVRLTIKIQEADPYWKISLSDQGIGIPQDLLSKVFDRYLAGAKGSGLGMSIVHALVVHRYNGRLEVTSSQQAGSSGTTIHMWLKKSNQRTN
jgi:two-component system, OmpR family, sensor histidine kinase VicK